MTTLKNGVCFTSQKLKIIQHLKKETGKYLQEQMKICLGI